MPDHHERDQGGAELPEANQELQPQGGCLPPGPGVCPGLPSWQINLIVRRRQTEASTAGAGDGGWGWK